MPLNNREGAVGFRQLTTPAAVLGPLICLAAQANPVLPVYSDLYLQMAAGVAVDIHRRCHAGNMRRKCFDMYGQCGYTSAKSLRTYAELVIS